MQWVHEGKEPYGAKLGKTSVNYISKKVEIGSKCGNLTAKENPKDAVATLGHSVGYAGLNVGVEVRKFITFVIVLLIVLLGSLGVYGAAAQKRVANNDAQY